MSKKMIIFIAAIFVLILGLFIFSEMQFRKDLVPEEKKSIKEKIKEETISKKENTDRKEKPATGEEKYQAKPLEDMSLEELKQKGAKKKKEEFDLTPSVDDLIKMKKEKIKTY